MPDEAIIRRLNRAKSSATSILIDAQFQIIPSDNSIFCIVGVSKNWIRMVRIAVDEITANDIKIVESIIIPPNCTREIWCREEGKKKFVIKEIE